MTSITELRDTLITLPSPPEDGSGRAVVERLDELRVLRNVLDHQIAVHIALLEASGAPARAGSTTRSWLVEMGMAPTAAHRYVRVAGGLASLPKIADCAAEGYLSAECVDAVVRGIAVIDTQAAAPLSDDNRSQFESELLAQAFSGATPAEIDTHARSIAVRVADADPDAVAPADDASLNNLHTRVTDEGRVAISGDVTAVIGEKFLSMIDERSCPRPEPDGADDRRSVGERRADGLELLLDQAVIGAAMTTAGAPRTQVLVTSRLTTRIRHGCRGWARFPGRRHDGCRVMAGWLRSSSTARGCRCGWAPRNGCSPIICVRRSSSGMCVV